MFFQLLFIHLFRPFLKYTQATSPLPHNVSPRKLCTQAAAMISKLMRLYKRSHGLRQIPNVAVYIAHSACTIHLLNLPDKNAKRDIVHGVRHLEEIAEGWLCARRTLAIISVLVRKWHVVLPEEASAVLTRTDIKFGTVVGEIHSPASQTSQPRRLSEVTMQPPMIPQQQQQAWLAQAQALQPNNYFAETTAQRPMTTSTGVSVPAPSVNYQPPPRDANGLRAQQHPSAASTPATQPRRSWASTGTSTRQAASPSDMFGGVEQLIRDSQEWAYRDQAQLASGFDNWNQIDIDPSTWDTSPPAVTSVGMPVAANLNGGGITVGGPVHMPSSDVSVAVAAAAPQTQTQTQTPAMDGLGMANWLNSMNVYNSLAGAYNEDEWYQ